MDTPRPRPPRPAPLSRRTAPAAPAPTPPPLHLSAPTSPSHDFSFSFSTSAASSPFRGHHLPFSMSGKPVARVGSDLSHHSHARTNHHQTTSYGASDKGRAAKNRASPFFSGLGGAWRKQSTNSDEAGKPMEEKRKKQTKRGLDVAQWVKKHMTAAVEQLRASFSRQAETTRERRRRPHSFSGHGPSPGAERDRERWRQRRGQLSSAPASLRVSPANSGHLSVGASVKVSTSSEESTMEELQSAIQAAIAHCKNSISASNQTTAAGETRSFSER